MTTLLDQYIKSKSKNHKNNETNTQDSSLTART